MTQTTIISSGFFFLIVFLFGYWLHHTGKPYKGLTLNVHKLVALAALAFLVVDVVQLNKVSSLGAAQWMACSVAALFFVAAIITGGLVSLRREMPAFVLLLHKILPYLVLVSTAFTFFLIMTPRLE